MISTVKNIEVFDPNNFKYPVHIIGCGALGSKVALEVAKLGIKEIVLHDFDKVEEHNLSNQFFKYIDIGELKAEALSKNIKEATNTLTVWNDKEVNKYTKLEGVIFICTDTMSSRIEIFENCCRYNPAVKFLIEMRMGVAIGRVYALNPIDRKKVEKYETSLYTSEEVVVKSACGNVPSIGATSSIISSMGVWQLIKFYNQETNSNYFNKENAENKIELETIFSLNPFQLLVN
jgi:molybdopterin/thiamine biosynthesis adenylyltransferase